MDYDEEFLRAMRISPAVIASEPASRCYQVGGGATPEELFAELRVCYAAAAYWCGETQRWAAAERYWRQRCNSARGALLFAAGLLALAVIVAISIR